MALLKVIGVGDELVFDISGVAEGARKSISVMLIERAGKAACLRISADRSIPISCFKQQIIPDETTSGGTGRPINKEARNNGSDDHRT